MLEVSFLKMQGLGNDFVVLDAPSFQVTPDFAKKIADRHYGIGCDQVLLLTPSKQPEIHGHLTVFNADGSKAEACGNGTRCVVSYLGERYGVETVRLLSAAGMLEGKVYQSDDVEVMQGRATLMTPAPLDLSKFGLEEGYAVEIGNPHLVVFVNAEQTSNLPTLGPRLERHPFFKNKTNVEFAVVKDCRTIELRVWERGAGLTKACASGASAAVFAAHASGILDAKTVLVKLEGGDLWVSCGKGQMLHHRGEAKKVFVGKFFYESTDNA
jgi:diaminopimelate epimerase